MHGLIPFIEKSTKCKGISCDSKEIGGFLERNEGRRVWGNLGDDGCVHSLDGDVVTVVMQVKCSDASPLYVGTKNHVIHFKYVTYYISVIAQ